MWNNILSILQVSSNYLLQNIDQSNPSMLSPTHVVNHTMDLTNDANESMNRHPSLRQIQWYTYCHCYTMILTDFWSFIDRSLCVLFERRLPTDQY